MISAPKYRLLIVDDSAISRGILEKVFSGSEFFDVVASVSNGRKAVDFCKENVVDVVVSDYDMPELNGVEATKILSGEMGIPVAIYYEDCSCRTAAIEAGAILFEKKPQFASYSSNSFSFFVTDLKNALEKNDIHPKHASSNPDGEDSSLGEKHRFDFKVLCIGASTGGPKAVEDVLTGLGRNFPLPILYVQHIDVGADKKMVDWFNSVCPNTPMHLATDGDIPKPGHVYMAPAEKHLLIDFVKSDGRPMLKISDEPPERFLRPAVNKTFRSAAHHYREQCLAVLLTGMGRDGAEGCKEIVDNGGYTIVEDRTTCAVFGMPAAAIELDAAKSVLPRNKIPEHILMLVNG